MDRFEDMRCFVQVVELSSVTRAAEAMNIAPSAVSRRIKELEARLGVQLLARTTRRMNLTEPGQVFYSRCKRILADLDDAEGEVGDAGRTLSGNLRLAAPLSFGTHYLSPLLADFLAEHPALRLDLDLSDRQVDLIGDGFDLAVRIGELADSTLVARKLCSVALVVFAAPEFLSRYGLPETPEGMRDWPALCYVGSSRPDIWRYTGPDGQAGSVQMRVRMRANNGPVLVDAARAGLGVAMQPSFILHEDVRAGRLVPILAGYRWPEVTVSAVYPQTRYLSARARAMIEFLAERLGAFPEWELAEARG